MGLLTTFTRAVKRKHAQNLIEAALEAHLRLGFFSGNVKEAARLVADFPGLRPEAYNLSDPILAAFMLGRYVMGSNMSHEELRPYALACSSSLSVATDPKSSPTGPTAADQVGVKLCLAALHQFYDASPIKLTTRAEDQSTPALVPTGLSDSDAISITDADSSMLCILREYELLNEIYGEDGNWRMCSQTHLEKDGRSYDVLEILVLDLGLRAIWFDITESKPRWTDHENVLDIARINAVLREATRDR